MTTKERTVQEKTDHAVILAAGTGVRFKEATHSLPKPLLEVAGVPLIERTIRTAQKAGILRFTVVTGYQGDKLEAFLQSDRFIDVEIQCVRNPTWERPNGVSAKLAEGLVPQRFVLLMSDHLFDAAILEKLLVGCLSTGHCRLAIDSNPQRVCDLEDATKVRIVDGRIVEIGKALENYNAIDTGIFLCSGALFNGLEKAASRGEERLTDGIRELARDHLMEAVDIGDLFWQDIDNERDLKHGEERLLRSLVSRTDSWLTRKVNRRISLAITRRLARTRIKPNHVTLFNFGLVLAGAGCAYVGSYSGLLTGSALFLLASILDGCDGEIARLKFQYSRFGAWLDIVTDNIAHLLFFTGVTIGLIRYRDAAIYALPGFLMVAGSLSSFVMMMVAQRRFQRDRGVIFSESRLQDTVGSTRPDPVTRFLDRLANRDFAFLLVFLACIDRAGWFLWIAGAGASVFALFFFSTLRTASARNLAGVPGKDNGEKR